MKRRNFISNLLVAGAGFFVLPAAKLSNRIWVPDRTIVQEGIGSVWDKYYMSRYIPEMTSIGLMGRRWISSNDIPKRMEGFGSVIKHNGSLWFRSHLKWHRLETKTCPLPAACIDQKWSREMEVRYFDQEIKGPRSFNNNDSQQDCIVSFKESEKLIIPEIL